MKTDLSNYNFNDCNNITPLVYEDILSTLYKCFWEKYSAEDKTNNSNDIMKIAYEKVYRALLNGTIDYSEIFTKTICYFYENDMGGYKPTSNSMVKEEDFFYIGSLISEISLFGLFGNYNKQIKSKQPKGCFAYCPTAEKFNSLPWQYGGLNVYKFVDEKLFAKSDDFSFQKYNAFYEEQYPILLEKYKQETEKSKKTSSFEDEKLLFLGKDYKPRLSLLEN